MKKLLIYTLGIALLCASCEDKKKASDNEIEIEKDVQTEVESKKEIEVKEEKSAEIKYPELTNTNVVEFLTQYGNDNPETRVLIETSYGDIEIKLYQDTPLHRANFIYLVKQGYFDQTVFHRIVPNFIIQAGNSDMPEAHKMRTKLGSDYLLPAEIIPGRIHQYGTVSGAKEYRENPDHRTAPYEFYIFLGPKSSASHLNGSYTIFGNVTKGMDVVETISELDADGDDWPNQNIYIKAKVIE